MTELIFCRFIELVNKKKKRKHVGSEPVSSGRGFSRCSAACFIIMFYYSFIMFQFYLRLVGRLVLLVWLDC